VTTTTTEAEQRRKICQDFALATGLPAVDRVVQHGTNAGNVRYTFHFTEGQEVRVRGAAILFSQAQLNQLFAEALRRTMTPLKAGDYREAVSFLIEQGMDLEEAPGERFMDTVAEWTLAYAERASTDKDGAAALRAPFRDDEDRLHVVATELAKYVRREFSEQVKLAELREALGDLGFERVAVHARSKGDARTTISYYRIRLAEIQPA
jgi:hypothetical protein